MMLTFVYPNAVSQCAYNIYIKLSTETETQEVSSEHQEACFYCEGD